MVFEDLDDDRQSEPRALRPRRYVRLGQTAAVFGRKPDAVVAYDDLDKAGDIVGALMTTNGPCALLE